MIYLFVAAGLAGLYVLARRHTSSMDIPMAAGAASDSTPPHSTAISVKWQNFSDDALSWPRVGDYLVSPDYIYPVGIQEATDIAKNGGFQLPTKQLVDEIWKAADLKVEPLPAGPAQGVKEYTQKYMDSPEVAQAQADRIAAQIQGKAYKLLAGTHKDIITNGTKSGIYGWHKLDGKPIQDPMFGHAGSWRDYSQGLRLVKFAPLESA